MNHSFISRSTNQCSLSLKTKQLKKQLFRDRYLLLILFLPLIYYIIFRYWPMYGVIIAFKNLKPLKGIWGSPWVGLKHFMDFFNSFHFSRVMVNTLLLSLYGIVFVFPLPIILALLLNEVKNLKFKKAVQTISYLPYFISTVVVVSLVVNFLSPSSGIVNILIQRLGFEPVHFRAKPEYFRTIYTAMMAWKTVGWSSIIYIAALSTIDVTMYEASRIDGASKFQQIVHITLPGILPTISIMLILSIGNILNVNFESIILWYIPAIYSTADVIPTYVYRRGIVEANFSYAAAVGLFQNTLGFALVILTNKISNKLTGNGLW